MPTGRTSAFIIFLIEQRQLQRLRNNHEKITPCMVGEKWRNLCDVDREIYTQVAKHIRYETDNQSTIDYKTFEGIQRVKGILGLP